MAHDFLPNGKTLVRGIFQEIHSFEKGER